ncbi:MAG: Spy/CpxP family protein refolding chaperone, partial [Mariniblastus sp.]
MTILRLIKTSTFTLAVAALVAFASNQAQAQLAFHGPNGGGVHIGGGGVAIHGGGHGGNWGGGNNWGGGHG